MGRIVINKKIMKAAFSLAVSAACVSAQTIFTTNNECWKGEGGRYVGSCRDVFYLTCDEYEVAANTACNVFTFSDSRVEWNTSQISVVYWAYNQNQPWDKSLGKTSGDDFGGSGRCYGVEDVPQSYDKGEPLNYTEGMCGFKYQITNANEDWPNDFTVMKDGAASLLSGAAVLLAATLAF